jgi:hypothetical protein
MKPAGKRMESVLIRDSSKLSHTKPTALSVAYLVREQRHSKVDAESMRRKPVLFLIQRIFGLVT